MPVQAEVEELTAQLSNMRGQFEAKTAEAASLRDKAELMERRLVAASRLIDGLGSERMRWAADLEVHDFIL
jgi:dynein heavy chain, axonemal